MIVSVRGRQPAQALPCVYEVLAFCGFTDGIEALVEKYKEYKTKKRKYKMQIYMYRKYRYISIGGSEVQRFDVTLYAP